MAQFLTLVIILLLCAGQTSLPVQDDRREDGVALETASLKSHNLFLLRHRAINPMNWSPARGLCDFSEHFFVLPCILFHGAPSPEAPGTNGKECLHCSFLFSYRPRPAATLLFVLALSDGTRDFLQERGPILLGRRPASRRRFIAQDPLGIRPAMRSIHSSDSVVLRIHRLVVLLFLT